ncbi:MAG: hypothetical protein ACQGVK_22980 [Myxococcota bacterium]
MDPRLVTCALVSALAFASSPGCERPASAPESERLARRYLPFDPAWIPEAEIPAEPQESPGMVIWEVSGYDPRVPATAAQREAGEDFVRRCFEAAVENGWFHRPKGMADGFLTPANDRLHYRNDEYVLDGIQLDPERPEYLMYYPDPTREDEFALTGFMFLADGAEARGHQFAGPLAIWHYHVYTRPRCWEKDLLSLGPVDEWGRCPGEGVARHRSPEMVHVWFIDHPRGAFSSGMTLPRNVLDTGLALRREKYGF